MAYTKEDLLNLGVTLEDLGDIRKKIVDVRVFDYIDDLILDNTTLTQLNYTINLYQNYLNLLLSYSAPNLEKILKGLRNTEVIDNHVVERENYNWLLAYQDTHHSTAINYLIKKLFVEQESLNSQIICKSHEILMRGTSNEEDITLKFRKNNQHFVGYVENNKNVITFLPVSFDEIKLALKLFCNYYNQQEDNEITCYVKPFIIHGLLGALQIFEDGNTRVARSIQHIKMFQITREQFSTLLKLPALYFSKTYIPYRKEYRDLICKIALDPTNQTWNEWITFNLRKVQDQIYFNECNLERTRKL